MRTNRTNIAITPAEAAELSSALFSSGSAVALELAPVFADIASGRLTAIELAVVGSQTSAAAGSIVIGELSIDLASRAVKVSDAPRLAYAQGVRHPGLFGQQSRNGL